MPHRGYLSVPPKGIKKFTQDLNLWLKVAEEMELFIKKKQRIFISEQYIGNNECLPANVGNFRTKYVPKNFSLYQLQADKLKKFSRDWIN